jgi:hypothetical protein
LAENGAVGVLGRTADLEDQSACGWLLPASNCEALIVASDEIASTPLLVESA